MWLFTTWMCAASFADDADDRRAQVYFQVRLSMLHRGHDAEYYVRDTAMTNALSEFSLRLVEIHPGTRIDVWARLDSANACAGHNCVQQPPPVPDGVEPFSWATVPVRQRELRMSPVRILGTEEMIVIQMRSGYWGGMFTITIPDAVKLREILP